MRFVHILPEGIPCELDLMQHLLVVIANTLFPVEVGACIEPLAVAWHAVERSGYKAGQSALIIGAGPVC